MTKTMKRLMILALLTVVSVGLKAQDANGEEPQVTNAEETAPQVKVDISGPFDGGEVKAFVGDPSKEDGSVVVTLTVTPAEDYYITKEDLVVVATYMQPQKQEAETRAEGDAEQKQAVLGGPIELTGEEPDDLTSERLYQFTLAEGLGAWVQEANFHSTALVLGSDVKEIADGSLFGVKTITIENNQKVIGLGENDVTGLTVVVPANLYNEYKTTEGWEKANITVDEKNSVEMGISFTEKNDYVAFYSEKAVLVPSVLKGYTVNGRDKDDKLILKEVGTVIPAGEPVLLFSKEINDDDFRTVLSEPDEEQKDGGAERTRAAEVKNALQVVTDDTKTDEKGLYVELGQVYMLYNDVFYFTQAGYIPVGGIYLDPKALVVVDEEEPAAPMKARFYLGMPNDAGTTGIKEKVIENSEKFATADWYSLDGRRLSAKPARKGLYIHDGKKVVIK